MRSLDVLAGHADAPYFALCDQDDVWKPQRLELGLRAVQAIEEAGRLPALAVSDLVVVDAELRQISPSFWQQTGNARHAREFGCLPVFNAFPGCTMLGNRALLQAAFPVPAAAPMHDYWIALVARYGGRAVALDEGLVLYRQHGRNQCGVAEAPSLPRRVVARLANVPAFFEQARRSADNAPRPARRRCRRGWLPCRAAPSTRQRSRPSGAARSRGLPSCGARASRPTRAFVYWLG